MIRRNCNLDLHLHHQPMREDSISGCLSQNQKQLTIMYNGRVSVCDVTELQARAILMLASRETENRFKTTSGSTRPNSPTFPSQLYKPSAGLSMTRSIQRFLQKRKNRIQATSPYNWCTKVETWSTSVSSRDQ